MAHDPNFKLYLPESNVTPIKWIEISTQSPVVIVGGNGSGKTRFGSKLELDSPIGKKGKTHRIVAQRSLEMPETTTPTSVKQAVTEFLYGNANSSLTKKSAVRYNNKPETHLTHDYVLLMKLLFSDDWEKATLYRQEAANCNERIAPPSTKLDIVKKIWEKTIPYRFLEFHAGKIDASNNLEHIIPYSVSELSDGERAIIYLIGQALAAPEESVIIIDEPEIYLHKAIQARLWDNIEAERPDCLFVYLTHDIEFAASRQRAKRICFQDFNGSSWNWFELPTDDPLPEEMLLKVVGSRKPVLFVEGTISSLDYKVYQHVYPGYSVEPCGGCEEVIHATKTFSSLKNMHRLECIGIVDRDFRSENDVKELEGKRIHTLPVAEIENLFLTENALNVIASHLEFSRQDTDEKIKEAKQKVFGLLAQDREKVVTCMVRHEVENKMKQFNGKSFGSSALKSSLEKHIAGINIDDLYNKIDSKINKIIRESDYLEAIKIYSNKGLVPIVAPVFGLKQPEFMDYILRIIAGKSGSDLIEALKDYLPKL